MRAEGLRWCLVLAVFLSVKPFSSHRNMYGGTAALYIALR